MQNPPHTHPVEDLKNISKETKEVLKSGLLPIIDLNTGLVKVMKVPWDKVLTDGTNVLVDADGNILVQQ